MSGARKIRRAARSEVRHGLDSLSDEELEVLSKLCAKWQTSAPMRGQRVLGAVIAECDARLAARAALAGSVG